MKRRILAAVISVLMVLSSLSITAAEEFVVGPDQSGSSEDFEVAEQQEETGDLEIFSPDWAEEALYEEETVQPGTGAIEIVEPSVETEAESVKPAAAKEEASDNITGATTTPISSVTLKYSSMVYTGKARNNVVTVKAKVNGTTKTLKKDTDYTLSYADNVNVGKATITVKGKGKYSGTIRKTFSITAVSLASATLNKTSMVYTGQAQKPDVTVKAKVNGTTKTLKKGTDYTVSYADNKNVGTATVTIKGKGNFKGTKTKTFKITAVALASATLNKTSMVYTGKAQKPDVTVKATVNGTTKTLKKDTDYTVSYADNKNVGTATVTIKGKGNFKGTKTKTFKITAVSLSSVKLKNATMTYTGKARTQTADIVVKAKVNGSTVTLTRNTDYTVSYADNVEIGTATVTVKGKGNYKGTIKKTFKIVPATPEGFVDPINGWSVYDSLIDQIRTETDMETRTALMHQAEDILMDTKAVIPLYHYNDLYLQKSYVTDVYATMYSTKYFMYAQTENESNSIQVCLASEPRTIDPGRLSSVDAASLAVSSFAGLYRHDSDSVPVPDCAESCDVSADGCTYIVTLKEGLKWSDGSDLTAYDFEYSWKRTADPATKADYDYLFAVFEGYETEAGISVAALDERTLQFTLTAPCAYMKDLMAMPAFFPVKQSEVEAYEGWEDNPDLWCSEAGFISNGPFVCTEWVHDSYIIYTKNPNYWDADNVSIERLRFTLDDDTGSIYEMYAAGNLDFIDDVSEEVVADCVEAQNSELHIVDTLGTYYFSFDVKSEIFSGMTAYQAACLREAVNILINREAILDLIGDGTGKKIAASFVPVGMADGNGGVFHESNQGGYYDVYAINDDPEGTIERARELLRTAGLRLDENGMLSGENPIEIKYVMNGDPEELPETNMHYRIIQSIANDLSVVGIEMDFTILQWKDFLEECSSGKYDAARGGWIADFNDPINMLELFASYSENNTSNFGK